MSKQFVWVKIQSGRRWQVRNADGKILGFVQFVFNGWDAYIMTGKKWPQGQRCVNFRDSTTFWGARRHVEYALADIEQNKEEHGA